MVLQLLSPVSKLVEGTVYVGKEGEKGVRKKEEKPTTKRGGKTCLRHLLGRLLLVVGCFAQFGGGGGWC